MPEIIEASGPEGLAIARRLFQEYAASLGVDLGFQGFAEELAGLPGAYARPTGGLLLGFDGSEPAGCVAFRPLEPGIAEMKRLYVRPSARGGGLGPQAGGARDRRCGGGRDTSACASTRCRACRRRIGLYLAIGFREIAPYRHNPVRGHPVPGAGAPWPRRGRQPPTRKPPLGVLYHTTMTPESLAFLKSLLDTPGPSSFEAAPARVWRKEAETLADEVRADVAGNSFATLNPAGRPRVMLAGHIDEIGVMVTPHRR